MQPFPPFSGEAYLNVATIVKSLATGQTVPLSRRVVALSLFNVAGHLTDQAISVVGDAPAVLVLTATEMPSVEDQVLFFEAAGCPADDGTQKALSIPSWALPILMQLIQKFLEGLIKTS